MKRLPRLLRCPGTAQLKSLLILAVTGMYVCFLVLNSAHAAAAGINTDFYNVLKSGVYYADPLPDCTNTGGTSPNPVNVTGSNIKIAMAYLMANGFNGVQAAGIVGNLDWESGVDPTRTQGGGGGGYGIAQWTPPTAMDAWIIAKGGNPNSLGGTSGKVGQLDFLLWDLKYNNTSTYKQVQSDQSVQSATTDFMTGYERPGQPYLTNRINMANAIYAKYGNSSSSSGGSGSEPVTDCSGVVTGPTGCADPFRDIKNLRPERIDQGVDYAGTGPVYAVCNGKITNTSGEGGWNYGGADSFITVQFTLNGHQVTSYMAEGCPPAVHVGQQVTSSTKICTLICDTGSLIDQCTGIETGWAPTPIVGTMPIAQQYGGSGCCSTTAGVSYNKFLTSLHTPSGNLTNKPIGQALPSYYP